LNSQPPSPPAPQSARWYCIHTRPQKEAQVAAYCQETLQLETYFPKLREHRTIRRVRRVVTVPLFPRYLFCRFDLAPSYRAVRYAPDAINVVHLGEKPAVVDDQLIEELRGWAGEALDVISIRPPLRPGDAVEIIDGPMRGLSAVILHSSDDRDRVAILLSILQHGAQMTISRSQIKKSG
jgi:transcriptional antiterminator RfaH